MNSQSVETREQLADELTAEQIQQLIEERAGAGASCKVEKENDKRVLVCLWPRL